MRKSIVPIYAGVRHYLVASFKDEHKIYHMIEMYDKCKQVIKAYENIYESHLDAIKRLLEIDEDELVKLNFNDIDSHIEIVCLVEQ